MFKKIDRSSLLFLGGALAFFIVVQALISLNVLTAFWNTILRIGGVMAIVSIGLNLIYGFNGQFSLGQWGFYAIGAYSAADITYRWTNNASTDGLIVLLLIVLLVGTSILLLYRLLSRIRGLDALSAFTVYLLAAIGLSVASVQLGRVIAPPVNGLLQALPPDVATTIVFILAVLIGGLLAAEVSFLFGLPVLTLGSDYFGIATLGFTIIVKVLLDNSDTLLGFTEMKGARGMIGIPKVTSWFWVMFFLVLVLVITRNLIHSSTGRAIISVREDEIAAKAMGIDVGYFKTLTFVLGSLFAGLAGGLYAHVNGFLHPDTFNFIKSFDPMIIVVFGGLGSITGTVFASFAWALVLEGFLRLLLPSGFETWRFVVYPLLLLIMMLLKPNGLFGNFEMPYLRQILPPLRKKTSQPQSEGITVKEANV
ncbi:MAG TPA: branched-chain amino acid ABC transporter permease [Anaerolinea thermolimosa]|uniref:Branched-chain amino acid ABC transporter permease n=1 Tax=Anaerolinea thermolimosa TaxID=229919 RepID=A0A3D1JDI5_9CHLR|nr:branched-chain amino acid ABC transporter permease [Anaerolinea thermolimosa]GAP07204.1 amino acid/amide ABC transporter membrane protein 2, HAAT family [Anaerolinea thermolimosa]HCE16563.1 branched-chain amino acid ABC transporter permease [Anaerolinea thermolimosa]